MAATIAPFALDVLGSWIDDATAGRHLPDPMLDIRAVASTNNSANSALYIRAIRSRLAALGYLPAAEAQSDVVTPVLIDAIRIFQREAGTAVDGWAGPLTKQCLQQLVSFEDAQDPAQWGAPGDRPADFPAVGRAVYLRLYTLGLIAPDAPLGVGTDVRVTSNPAMAAGLRAFLQIASELGLCDPVLEPALDTATLGLLFRHDAIVLALANHAGFFDGHHAAFVQAIGCVELWLLGYDVSLNGTQTPVAITGGIPLPHRDQPPTRWVSPVDIALGDLAQRLADDQLKKGFGQHFFQQVTQMIGTASPDADAPTKDEILRCAIQNRDDIAAMLGRLAARIWDGAKRLWGWLKNAFSTGADKTDQWNVARFIASQSRSAFEIVLKAIDIVHRGATYYAQPMFAGSSPDRASLALHKDFDADLFINASALSKAALDLVGADREETACFILGGRILQALVDAIADVVQLAAAAGTFVGWFALLVGLSRCADDLRQLRDTVADFDELNTGDASMYCNPIT
jgi:hypothetical protein